MNGQNAGAAGAAHAAADPESIITTIAMRQHGVVARWQLLAAGPGAAAIDWLVRCGRLHPLHRGVYRVGPLPQPRERLMTGVLLCGDAARVSHGTAAALLGLLIPRPADVVHVTGLNNRRVPDWLRLHRVRSLSPDEVTLHENIPTTTPLRTLLDLAAVAPAGDVEHAMIEVLRRHLADPPSIAALLARHAGRPGARTLRELLERADSPRLTRGESERLLRRVLRLAEIADPLRNVRVEGYEVDTFWPRERVVAEVDGFAFHSSHAAFQRDRRRDADLAAAGITVIRITWHQLTQRPYVVAARLAAVLATSRERLARPG